MVWYRLLHRNGYIKLFVVAAQTSNNPSTTRRAIIAQTLTWAASGVSSVSTAGIPMLTPNTYLPPNLVANQPPGICMTAHP